MLGGQIQRIYELPQLSLASSLTIYVVEACRSAVKLNLDRLPLFRAVLRYVTLRKIVGIVSWDKR